MSNRQRPHSSFGAAFDAEYDALPESIKMIYSPKEWAWLGWEQRQHEVERECLPDVPED
jgi:hypothetical protein